MIAPEKPLLGKQASIQLLDMLTFSYRENIPYGTQQLQRYLAVLGNPLLRERAFGF
ncbi:MAG: hypothetical protein PHE47_09970 [Oscillospiraceae bacterium]|nr:hypothetical protein [Oscillospiraceae bacterium]